MRAADRQFAHARGLTVAGVNQFQLLADFRAPYGIASPSNTGTSKGGRTSSEANTLAAAAAAAVVLVLVLVLVLAVVVLLVLVRARRMQGCTAPYGYLTKCAVPPPPFTTRIRVVCTCRAAF
jgi:hypothetical protein